VYRLPAGLIGPNAIVRTVEALRAHLDEPGVADLLRSCSLERYLHDLPQAMVPEAEVTALYASMRAQLDRDDAREIARDAGYRTADYVTTHRIPSFVQGILPALPRQIGRRMLMFAIRANAWTFAGSARIRMRMSAPASISLVGCPICSDARAAAPACGYYAATFERLFRTMVDPAYRVEEVACRAEGGPACVFQIEAA
jgi:divinyl protochlorophyllide a 8-vinyl-reductase